MDGLVYSGCMQMKKSTFMKVERFFLGSMGANALHKYSEKLDKSNDNWKRKIEEAEKEEKIKD